MPLRSTHSSLTLAVFLSLSARLGGQLQLAGPIKDCVDDGQRSRDDMIGVSSRVISTSGMADAVTVTSGQDQSQTLASDGSKPSAVE